MALTATADGGMVNTERLRSWECPEVRAAFFLHDEFHKAGLRLDGSIFCLGGEPPRFVVNVQEPYGLRIYGTYTGTVRDLLRVVDELREYRWTS